MAYPTHRITSIKARAWRHWLLVLAMATLMLPRSATAAAQPATPLGFTIEELHTRFVDAGYQVDQPITWDWLSPPVSTFQVHDLRGSRLLLVQLYATVPEAQLGEQRMRTVTGYSACTWMVNVAVCEASEQAYRDRATASLARSMGMNYQAVVDTRDDALSAQRVDEDFLSLLFEGPPASS